VFQLTRLSCLAPSLHAPFRPDPTLPVCSSPTPFRPPPQLCRSVRTSGGQIPDEDFDNGGIKDADASLYIHRLVFAPP
jgi:hypothetical protein